ncbi:MAG: formate dehydrogenase accessory sulfurtransferase FdhD [Methylococcaceae bacterium]|nr:formate dehydrogenase accessory sulfurtransferase FdhD [Methylococcaceae bacterium]
MGSGVEEDVPACPSAPPEAASGRFGLSGELGWPAHTERRVWRWRDGTDSVAPDRVAEEAPVALVYNGEPHVVMLCTPLDLEDFAVGFSLTEGLVAKVEEVQSVRVHYRAEGIEVRIRVPEARFQAMAGRERNLTGRTGCGLCGSATLKQAVRHPPPVTAAIQVRREDLRAALDAMGERQGLNQITGAVHAAGWFVSGEGLKAVREDVGRHNALDKLLGLLARTRFDRNAGFAVVTSRASYEMVQKCAMLGIGFLAAISAPTGLAIRLAEETGLTLVGFARGSNCVVYANHHRFIGG